MNTMVQMSTYFIQAVAGLYLGIFLVRLLLQLSRADFYNPVSQFVVKATAMPLVLLRRIIPPIKQFDTASLVFALLLQWLAIQITVTINGGGVINPLYCLEWGLLGIVSLTLDLYFYGLLAAIIISWVAPHSRHPLVSLVWQIMEPVMAPCRRVIPSFGGIDLSPLLIFIVINMLRIFVANLARAAMLPAGFVPGI